MGGTIIRAIRDNPEVAAGYYIPDNDRLNAVYVAAKKVIIQPDNFTLGKLRQAIREAEGE